MVTKTLKEINAKLFKAEREVAELHKQRQEMINLTDTFQIGGNYGRIYGCISPCVKSIP